MHLCTNWDIASQEVWREDSGLTRILGWQIDEVAPTVAGWVALQHPADSRERLKTLQDPDFFQENDNYVMEYRLKHKVGFYVWGFLIQAACFVTHREQ